MLPVVTEEIISVVSAQLEASEEDWKRQMVHRIKEDNPEVNTLLLELATQTDDPKAFILGGYLLYAAMELADRQQE